MIILKHRFFWILNLHHLLKEEVFFSKKKDTISANILNVRNKRYLKNLILSIWY